MATPADRPEAVILPESLDGLTLEQLNATLAAAIAEESWLTDHGDRTLVNSRRVRELRVGIVAIRGAIAEITAPLPEIVEAPAPVAEPVAVAEPVVVPDTPAEIVEQEMVLASIAQGDGVQHAPTVITEPAAPAFPLDSMHNGAPMFASATGTGWDALAPDHGALTTYGTVSQRMRALFRTGGHVDREDNQHMFRVDRFAELAARFGGQLRRAGNDPKANEAIFAELAAETSAIMAGFCGLPQDIEACGIQVRTDRPVAALFSGQTVPFGNGKFRWHKGWTLDQVEGEPVKQWTTCDQDAVDSADPTTWKPCATLPSDCGDDYCESEAYFLWRCLKVSITDELSRPDRIRDANLIIDALMARMADGLLLQQIDKNSQLRSFDASTTTLGAAAALPFAMAALPFAMAGIFQRLMSNRGFARNYTAIVPEDIASTIALDMYLAGERGGDAESVVREAFRMQGVNNVVFTPDWGCEGMLLPEFADDVVESCGTSCADAPVPCAAFGSGDPVEKLATKARIRLIDTSGYRYGQTGIIDYALRRSPELMQQNCAVWQGETAEALVKTCNRRDFVIDIEGLCPTGQRIEHKGAVSCAIVGEA